MKIRATDSITGQITTELQLIAMDCVPKMTIQIDGGPLVYDPIRLRLPGQTIITQRNNETDHIKMCEETEQ